MSIEAKKLTDSLFDSIDSLGQLLGDVLQNSLTSNGRTKAGDEVTTRKRVGNRYF